MLDLVKIEKIEALLAQENMSQRQISRITGVSRGIIAQIAAGNRPDYIARQLEQGALDEPRGPLARCGTCGGRVYMPCRLCEVRAFKAQHERACRARRLTSSPSAARQPLATRRPLPVVEVRKVG